MIRTGDPLFGSTVNNLIYGRDALNDAGQVAFLYVLADGRSGIALASVPEPGGAGVLALAGVTALRRRRQRG